MVAELKNYQAQVHAYKFEIDRINVKIKQCKDVYFQMRQQQLGVVQETDEEAYGDQQQMMGAPQGYGQPQMDDQAFLQQQQQQFAAMQQQQQMQQMQQQQQMPVQQEEQKPAQQPT